MVESPVIIRNLIKMNNAITKNAEPVLQAAREEIFLEFKRYLALSDDMVEMSSREALIKTARILAMQAAHYAHKYGEEPLIDLSKLLADNLSEESAIFLRDGAKTFVGVLGVVASGVMKEATDLVQ